MNYSTIRASFTQATAPILKAEPESIQLDAKQTALIVVDMQNAYTSLGGYLDLAGFDVSKTQPVVKQIQQAIDVAHAAGIQVIFFKNGWDADYVEAGGEGSPNFHKSNAIKTMRKKPELQGKLLSKGGWDYELIDELQPAPQDIVIEKPRYSGFFHTQLDSILRAKGIRNLVFTGIATNVCVESTLRDGFFWNISVCYWMMPAIRQGQSKRMKRLYLMSKPSLVGCLTLKVLQKVLPQLLNLKLKRFKEILPCQKM